MALPDYSVFVGDSCIMAFNIANIAFNKRIYISLAVLICYIIV